MRILLLKFALVEFNIVLESIDSDIKIIVPEFYNQIYRLLSVLVYLFSNLSGVLISKVVIKIYENITLKIAHESVESIDIKIIVPSFTIKSYF